MKILNIVGARPQFIKSSTISRSIKNKFPKLKEIIVHTGQHYDQNMSKDFFNELKIPKPKYNLKVGSGDHSSQITKIISRLKKVILLEKPDWIIVYGDTNTTLAASLVGSRENIKIAHIESGIRSYNMEMPEEINRLITDRLSTLLFCPTKNSIKNLHKENIKTGIFFCGDVMFDSYKFHKFKIKNNKNILKKYNLFKNKYLLLTIHRSLNTDNIYRLKNIIKCFDDLSNKIEIVFPIHPRTLKNIKNHNIKIKNLKIIKPVAYNEMINLINSAKFIATDSGGLQKEAFYAKKQCFTIRDETEWPETTKYKNNIICSPNKINTMKKIIITNFSKKFYDNKKFYYGNGNAAYKILKIISKYNKN